MKTLKVSFDFSDRPELINLLRMQAARSKRSQKAILQEALEAYFSNIQEDIFLSSAANSVFEEWNNDEDKVYDTL